MSRHFLHQWTIQIICSSGVRAWKSQWPTSCLPGPSSNPLTHGSAPSPSETGKFLDLRLFFFFLSNVSKVLAKKKKKIPHLLHHPHNPPFLFPNPIFPCSSLSSTQVPGTELILWHYTSTSLAFHSLLFFGTLHSNAYIFPFLLCL